MCYINKLGQQVKSYSLQKLLLLLEKKNLPKTHVSSERFYVIVPMEEKINHLTLGMVSLKIEGYNF